MTSVILFVTWLHWPWHTNRSLYYTPIHIYRSLVLVRSLQNGFPGVSPERDAQHIFQLGYSLGYSTALSTGQNVTRDKSRGQKCFYLNSTFLFFITRSTLTDAYDSEEDISMCQDRRLLVIHKEASKWNDGWRILHGCWHMAPVSSLHVDSPLHLLWSWALSEVEPQRSRSSWNGTWIAGPSHGKSRQTPPQSVEGVGRCSNWKLAVLVPKPATIRGNQ